MTSPRARSQPQVPVHRPHRVLRLLPRLCKLLPLRHLQLQQRLWSLHPRRRRWQLRKLPLNVQGVAAAGVTVRVKGIEIGTDATVLDVSISFANRITSSTMLAMLDTYLEDESGSRLQIKRPTNNRDLIIREGEMLNGQLVFMGAVPASARKLRLVFNESNTDDNIVAPGFSVDLPLSGG